MNVLQKLIVDYNRTASAYPAEKTIIELFVAQVARTPDDEAVRFQNRTLTYRELDQRSNQIAAHLRTLGVAPGKLVVLLMEHSIEVVCAILGTLKAGGAYVPVDPITPPERLAFVLRDVAAGCGGNAPVLITHEQLGTTVPDDLARVFRLDEEFSAVAHYGTDAVPYTASPRDLAYIIYTSGSTGTPKGVMIENQSLVNYIWWANAQYCQGERLTWPLFSSLAFDLTVTSTFTPLISGGRIVAYREDPHMRGTAVLKVIEDNLADIVKLTPAHLAMVRDLDLSRSRIRKLILGGEELKTELARSVTQKFSHPIDIYNEYGPTEATVGCMIHRYDMEADTGPAVPIGVPAANTAIYLLNEQGTPVAPGVVGEMHLAGDCLARGYFNRQELTDERFVLVPDPARAEQPANHIRVYKTGDLARWTTDGRMEFLGRRDLQVKVGGVRIELGEIEARLLKHPDITDTVATVFDAATLAAEAKKSSELVYCTRCGLASNLPGTTMDADGVCNLCRAFDTYVDKAQAYFKTPAELNVLAEEMKRARTGKYDCLVLFSGGKDSTFMLYQLVDMGLEPLVFTLDNGFISEGSKANIRRVVEALGVDHIFGTTPHMNEIFVDSLNRFANVCNGCFKTIYTLATNIAVAKGIKHIVTGLSRGQFFETRLTEEVFKRKDFDVAKLDALVLEARKAYHQREDAVSAHLAVDVLRDESTLDQIQFVDFYRYWSVPLEEMYAYLRSKGWVKPKDTGRSTNCRINDLGIYIHKKQRGYHNYALPYSWDVRLGQKTREEAMAELDDEIDEEHVKQMMAKIGYTEPPPAKGSGVNRLVAYYVSDKELSTTDLRAHMAGELPDFMIPAFFVRLEKLPLTSNGKVDRNALPPPSTSGGHDGEDFVGPQTETQKSLAKIWTELLNVERIGIHDEFFELGGHSLLALRAVSRIRDAFGVNVSLETMFVKPTIAGLAEAIDKLQGGQQRAKGATSPTTITRQVRRAISRPTK